MVQSRTNFGKQDTKIQKWICLDLDGTLVLKTSKEGSLKGVCHEEIIQTLSDATKAHWQVAIITGRTLSFAMKALFPFTFPYFLAVQQGSHLFRMPEQKLLLEHLIDPVLTQKILSFLIQEKVPTIAYLGYEKGDACIYSLEHVSKSLLSFYQKIEPLSLKPWILLPTLTQNAAYPSSLIKSFSTDYDLLSKAAATLQKTFPIATVLIKDPLSPGQFYLLITTPKATKGSIVQELLLKEATHEKSIRIGAGDDENDYSMLRLCQYRLVMDDAPPMLKDIATTFVSAEDPLDLPQKIRSLLKEIK